MEIIQYPIFSEFPELQHFCTTRNGGFSLGNYASFNMSPFTGDTIENQRANIDLLVTFLRISSQQLIFPYQTHSNQVKVIGADFQNLSDESKSEFLNGVDALITNQKGICIAVTTADCVPILLYDAANKVVAAIHAGWRGTCSHIVQHTIQQMTTAFGTEPTAIFASIGVSISPEVYNVGKELIAEFEKNDFPIQKIFTSHHNQLFLDLWEANKWLLTQAGVPENQIEVASICTFSNSDTYFSARKLGIKSGRMLSCIMVVQ